MKSRLLVGLSVIALVLTMSVGAQADLPVTNGLQAHFDASAIQGVNDGGLVDTWADQSGNGNDATQGNSDYQPTFVANGLNGLPVLRLNEDWFGFNSVNIRTVFFVLNEAPGTSSNWRPMIADSSDFRWHRGEANTFWSEPWGRDIVSDGTTTVNGVEVEGEDGNVGVVTVPTEISVISHVTLANAPANQIGRDRGWNSRTWIGDMAEILIFDRVLSQIEMELVGFYLSDKWGITTAYPEFGPTPVLDRPTENAEHVALDAQLQWHTVFADAPTFDVYLCEGTDPNFLTVISAGQTETSFAPELQYATTYCWQVVLHDGGTTTASPPSLFATMGKAYNPAPVDGYISGTVPTTTLSWTADDVATSFKVYAGQSEPLSLLAETTETSVVLSTPSDFTGYLWRVDQLVDGVEIAAGDVWTFTTGGLIGRWELEENPAAGDPNLKAIDSSGFGFDAEVLSDSNSVPGILGRAYSFDGITDEVVIPPFDITTNAMSFSLWVKASGAPQGVRGLIVGRGPTMAATGINIEGGHLRYHWADTYWWWNSPHAVPADEWIHETVVVEPTKATIYMNGVPAEFALDGTAPVSHGMLEFSEPLVIATDPGNTGRHFAGTIDDVRIFSRALTAEQVLAIYDDSAISKHPSPATGEKDVVLDTVLSWQAGPGALSFNVYFGRADDPDWDATAAAEGITDMSLDPLGGAELELFTEYIWRVDVVTASGIIPGNTWTFTSAPPRAFGPTPENGAVEVHPDADLNWMPGEGGVYTHDVYFGTDAGAVAAANNGSPEFQGNQGTLTFDPGTLDWNTTYFWRINELDGINIFDGDVWSFTTIDPVCSITAADGDLTGDCVVTLADLAVMAGNWMVCGLEPVEACPF